MSIQTWCCGNLLRKMTNKSDQIDSDYDVEGNNKFKKKELKNSSPLFSIVIYNVDGPSISTS